MAIFMLGTFFRWPGAKARETHKTRWSNKQWTYRGLGSRREQGCEGGGSEGAGKHSPEEKSCAISDFMILFMRCEMR
jgi:hypothetical protein